MLAWPPGPSAKHSGTWRLQAASYTASIRKVNKFLYERTPAAQNQKGLTKCSAMLKPCDFVQIGHLKTESIVARFFS